MSQQLDNIEPKTIELVLTPLKFLPELKPAFDILGSDEPNIIFPLSTVKRFAVQKYGGADEMEAVGNFVTEVLQLDAMQIDQQEGQQQTTVPPSQPQGIMTSPQNMEQV